MTAFTDAEKAACAKREVAQRKRVYPRLVEKGSLTGSRAAIEIALMEEIAAEYQAKIPRLI